MYRYLLAIYLAIPCISCGQDAEFTPSENGLIYTPKTVSQLRYIVDSLNLKFKVCDANPNYLASAQTTGHYVSLSGPQCKAAQKDMEAGISLDELTKKYKKVTVKKDLVIIRYAYQSDENKRTIIFRSIGIGEGEEQSISFEKDYNKYTGGLSNSWVVDYERGDKDYPSEIEAILIDKDFQTYKISPEYARWIQYADCLVDTSAQIYSEEVIKRGGWRFSDPKKTPNIEAFEKCVRSLQEDPTFDLSSQDPKLKSLSEKAYLEAKKTGTGSSELEAYFEKQGLAHRALELKRNHIVVGFCSQDSGPRDHAFEIAKLAAETTNWEIFLRSHLDIMNDNFERASDGSYAWAGRQTYVKELEVLEINVPDLLFGVCLQISNPGRNHYSGYIGRTGRALAEYSQPEIIENRLLSMMVDKKLDPYNRVLMYYLFLNYNHHLKDEKRRVNNIKRIELVKRNIMPGEMQERAVAHETK